MKPDTLENHYDNLLVGAEDWAIEQVKEDIQRLKKDNAILKKKYNILFQYMTDANVEMSKVIMEALEVDDENESRTEMIKTIIEAQKHAHEKPLQLD